MNFSRRMQALRQAMQESRLDLFLCTKRENVLYLCGFTGSAGVLLVGSEDVVFLTDGRYEIQAQQEVRGAEVEVTREELLPTACQKAVAKGVATVGFEADSLSYHGYQTLLDKVGQERVRSTSKVVEKLRTVKDDEEVEAMRAACLCVEAALRLAVAEVREGLTEKELAAQIDYQMSRSAARKPAFDTIVAFAEDAALPHASPRARPLARGEAILVDCGALLDGYCSDITRTFFLGEPGKGAAEAYQAVLCAQELGLQALQAGKKASEVDRVAREHLEGAGFGEAFNHSLGHGVGIEVHETPRLSWRDDTRLEEGMALTVEPGVYLEGLFGIRIEDLAVVRKGRPEVLTSFPKGWEEAVL